MSSKKLLNIRVIEKNKVATDNFVLNFPNVISSIRVALSPVLLFLAIQQKENLFLWILAASLITDFFDGYLARHLKQVTKFGAKLDSWADLITYSVMLFGLLLLWPATFNSEVIFLLIAFSSWIVPLLVCQSRFGRFPAYHTLAAKTTAILIAPAYFIAVIFGNTIFLRGVLLFYIWVALEQVIITSILPRWQSNIAGFWVAASIARNETDT
ncbi:MAG: hypothetical protein CMK44_01730 [Porticoccus sp.]|jgi:CDP-diacylglycerol--glycerol-3-phosphate 3-phosphatidyltransferase|nr:hypothetical protein [Porticoccus sp.]|tara:strand:- start:760 stop:1395 length:636 start_codon:yes stop_codon:yes gene_type:complete